MTAPPRRCNWREHCDNPACKWVRLYQYIGSATDADGRRLDGWVLAGPGLFRSAYLAGEYQRTHQEQP